MALVKKREPQAGLAGVLGSLLEQLFGSIPMPAMTGIQGASGSMLENLPVETLRRLQEVFRPKDLSKVMPAFKSQVPAAPGTKATIDSAFGDYRKKLADLLLGGNQ